MAKTTTIKRRYKFDVLKPGETTFSSTTIDLSFTSTEDPVHLTGLDSWGGQRVRGVEARAESMPWTVNVAETTNEEVTSSLNLSTLLGPDIMRRTARLQVAEPATSTYESEAGGRVTDLAVSEDEQDYEFTIRDDLFVARTAGAFNHNTCKLLPRGPAGGFFTQSDPGTIRWEVTRTSSKGDGTATVRPRRTAFELSPNEAGELIDDVVGTPQPFTANFNNASVHVSSDDASHVAVRFGASPQRRPAKTLQDKAESADEKNPWVNPVSVQIQTTTLSSNQTFDGYLHAFGRNPSTVLPRHVSSTGQSATTDPTQIGTGPSTGIDPMKYVQHRYDNANVRTPSTLYQTRSASKPNAVLDHDILKLDDVYIRVTEPTTSVQAHLERVIFKPHGVAPLVTPEGEVRPKYVRQPDRDDIPSTTDLFTFSSSNIADRHPTWDEGTNEQVTKLDLTFSFVKPDFETPPRAADRFIASTFRQQAAHATSVFGEHERRIRAKGLTMSDAAEATSRIAHDAFERFGNGPIRSRFRGMSDASTVQPGDFIIINVPTLPKAPDALRGGDQIFQVMSRTGTPKGPEFEALELGPSAQPLSAPDASIVKSATNPKHAVDLSVSNLAANADASFRLAASSVEPSDNSEWTLHQNVISSSSGTYTKGRLPSGSKVWAQARASKTNEIRSSWSTSVNVTLDSIPAPTTLTITSTDHNTARYKWTNGTTEYPIHIILESSIQKNITAGSEEALLKGLGEDHTAGTTLVGAVQHFDEFGGKSAKTTDTFVLSTDVTSSPDMLGITIANSFFAGNEEFDGPPIAF